MRDRESARARERSLGDFLVARARAASHLRLAANAGGGLIAAVAIAIFRPPLWPALLAIAVSFAAYGTWAILDCELMGNPVAPSAGRRRLLVAGRAVTAVVGVLAALLGGLVVFFVALGDSWQL